MPYSMKDFQRDYAKEYFPQLTPEEQQEVLKKLSPEEQQAIIQALPPEARLAGLSKKQIQQYLDRLTSSRPTQPRPSRRKK
jgi:Mg/Co/Ni transporter MgtE